MDTNFLNIRIISYRDTATFQFVSLVPQVAQVAYYTNIFATLLISTIYDLKKEGLQINDDTNMFEIISKNPYVVVPDFCHLYHLLHKWHKLKSGCISSGNNGNG